MLLLLLLLLLFSHQFHFTPNATANTCQGLRRRGGRRHDRRRRHQHDFVKQTNRPITKRRTKKTIDDKKYRTLEPFLEGDSEVNRNRHGNGFIFYYFFFIETFYYRVLFFSWPFLSVGPFSCSSSSLELLHLLFISPEFALVLLGFTLFDCILPSFTGLHWVLLGFTGFYWVLLRFIGFYWVLLGFPGFYWVLLGFTGFYWVTLGFTGFYWILLGFNGLTRFAGFFY